MQKNCSCHFLYGLGTSEQVNQGVEKALESKEEYQAKVQFYKKNGNNSSLLVSRWSKSGVLNKRDIENV